MRTSAGRNPRPDMIKVVGRSGQVSIGKQFAGKVLSMRTDENGAIVLTPVRVVPESLLWTTREPHLSRINQGVEWAARHPPSESDTDAVLKKAGHRRRRSPRHAARK